MCIDKKFNPYIQQIRNEIKEGFPKYHVLDSYRHCLLVNKYVYMDEQIGKLELEIIDYVKNG